MLENYGWMFVLQGLMGLAFFVAFLLRLYEAAQTQRSRDEFRKMHEDKGIYLDGPP